MDDQTRWSDLLTAAVSEPGLILKAYSAFHSYSIGNQIAAMVQCNIRGIEPGPINTYPGWQSLGRQVRKGERALTLCMPLAAKRTNDDGEKEAFIKAFVYKPRWFVICQTDGEPYQMPPMPEWDKAQALTALDITEEKFAHTDGNVQGYATAKRSIAISPLATFPHKTLFHECGHILLGHVTEADFNDAATLPRSLREAEAEAVALLCLDALDLEGASYCKGYIQNWLKGEAIPERSAQRIFAVADKIIKAGQVATTN